MLNSPVSLLLTVVTIFCQAAPTTAPAPPTAPSTSPTTTPAPTTTPEDAVLKVANDFCTALARGDNATLKSLFTGPPASQRVLDSFTGYLSAIGRISVAAEARFGPASPLARSRNPGKAMMAALSDSSVRVRADTARLRLPGGESFIDFAKTDTGWKVTNFSDLEKIAAEGPKIDAGTKIVNQMTDEISAGKFADSSKAEEELALRLRQIGDRRPGR